MQEHTVVFRLYDQDDWCIAKEEKIVYSEDGEKPDELMVLNLLDAWAEQQVDPTYEFI